MIADPVPDARSHVRWTRGLPWALALVSIAIAVVAIVTGSRRNMSVDGSITRLELNLPPAVELYSTNGSAVAISPDGRSLAYVGAQAANRQVYVRRLDQSESIPLRGVGFVSSLAFSPNNESIAVMSSDGALRKVSLKDGVVVTVARATDSVLEESPGDLRTELCSGAPERCGACARQGAQRNN